MRGRSSSVISEASFLTFDIKRAETLVVFLALSCWGEAPCLTLSGAHRTLDEGWKWGEINDSPRG